MKLEEKFCLVDYSAKGSSINSDADHHSDILKKKFKMSQKIFNILNQRLKRDALHLCEPLCVLLGCVQGVDPDNNTVLLNVSAEDTCLQVDFATNSDQNIWKPSRLLEVMHHQDEEG